MFLSLVTAVHIFVCLVLVSVVLLQQGKGADMGATFGGGSQTVFGASGADNLLTRVTTTLAALFMVTSIVLAINAQRGNIDQGAIFQESQPAPAATTDATVVDQTASEKALDTSAEPVAEGAEAEAGANPAAEVLPDDAVVDTNEEMATEETPPN